MSPSQPNPSNENLTIAPFFETLEPRLLLSGVQGAEHARLLFDDTQLADIRANLTQEPYASMVARLIETAESGDPGDEPSMNDSANLQRTSFLYALTGDDIWAQKARTYAENRIFDTGVEAWADPSVKGLRLYMHGKAVALAYDFAFDAPSWNTDDFKEIVSQKLLEQADVVFESGGTEQNKDPASNWQGNRWSSAAIMYMATDEAFPEGRLDVAFDHVVEYLDANVGSDPRAAGWNIEGVGYLGYPFGSFVGPYGIMAERYDPYDMNLKEVSPASQSTAWTQYAATVPFHGSLIRPDFGDDHASALAAEGVYGLALGYAPAELQPGLHYWYDRTVGTEGEGTGDFDVRRAGTIYGLMYYDDDIVQQDPMTMPEWRKRFLDSYGNGFFTFRNQYLDSTDLVSQFYAKLRGETGHSGPDALSFRILGLDTAWAVGGGRGGLNLNGTEAYYRSQNTLYKNDPQTGTISVNGNSGSVVGNPLIQEDGSGHVVTQISKNNLGVNNQKRWYLSDFSKDAGVDGVFVVGDTSDDGYFWNFNTLEENAVSTNGNTFLIQGQDGATLKGTVLYAPGGVTWSTGTRIRGTEFSQQIENFDDDENNYVSYQSTSGDHLVVMTIARAGQTHPTVSMSGSSVEGAVVTVGSKTYTLTSDDVLYDGQVAQRSPIASYSATPDRGMYPLTVTFDAGDSFDPDGDSLTYFWEFGDGSTATGEVVQHTYTTEGLFNARLTIDDGFGNIDRVTKSISARNQPPTARFTMDTNYGAAPLVVNFDGSTSTDPENDTLTYTWDFGDGSTGTGVTPSHTYDIPGNYTVVLTVDDGNGNQHTSDQTLLASRPMDGGGRANTIVDWSGDKIGVDKITLDQDEYRVTLDIDNDGQADDTWARIDLDLGLPLSPDNNYFAQPFYGGASSREIDGTSAQLADFQLGDNVEGDSFYFRTGGNKRDLDLLIYFDKQDFFHGGSNYAVSFNTDSSISMGGVLNSSNIESYRWVVREGTTFYVSEKVATPSTGYTLTFEADNDDGRWAVYDPTSGIDFDQDAATFTSQNFSNVTAVGLVVDSDLVNSTEKRFAFDEFKVVADVDSPPATPQRPTVFNTAFEIVEQMPNGTILGSVQAADPNPSDTLTWSILQGNEDGVWTINSSTGEISVADNTNLRYYRNADFKLTVQATDNTGRTGIGFVDVTTIQILPYNAEPSLSDGLMKVLDNAPNGQLVGQMLLDDANVDQYHDFKITSGNAAGIFAIDPQTGAITVVNNSSLNASAQSRYNLNIRAQDPFGIVTTAVAMVDVLPAPATSQTAIIEFGGDVLDGSQILGREFTYGADLDGNGGDSVELVPFTATPLINETVGYRGPKFYGGFLAQTLNGSTSVNPTVGGSGGDDTLNIEYNPGGLGTMNGFIFVDKADFVHGGDSATVTFDSSSSLRLREVARFQGFDDVRWLVRDGSNFYVSEQKPNASNGYTLTFASDTNDGNWASFDPYASYDFDEATTFQSRNFTNITAVGLYLGRDIPDGDRQWLTIGGLDVYAKTAGANVPPIAVTDTATTAEDTATNINVTANDIDPTSGETLTVVSVSQPDFGTAAINGSQVTYTPDTGYRGVDSFIYTVVDSAGNESHGLVNVSVGTGNLPPSAWAKLASVEENQSVVVDVLSNDSDPENDSLSVQSVTQGAHGTVINNGSSVTYTPDSEYFGTDSFTYTVTDGNGNSDTATIYMTITEVPPQSPFGNGGQPWPVADGLRIEAENFDAGVNGDAYFDTGAGNNGGRYRTDVDVDIQDASDSSGIYNLAWNADGEWLEYSVDVTGGTYDIVLRVASGLTNPGSIRLLLDGQELGVVKVPATGSMQSWTDATLSDVSLTGGPGILRMEIIDGGFNINYMEFNQTGGPTNQAPTATNDTAVTNEDTAVVVDVLANDSDPDTGDTLGVQSVTQGSNGSVTNNGSNVTYTPNAGFTGSDSFTYTVSDGNGGSDTATVNVTVNATGSSVGDFDIAEDIGAVAASGSASYSSGTYTVTASGADVWNDADEFHYVHEALTGDGQITARVVSQDNTHAWAKAGVMIRDGVGAGAKNVFVGVTPGNGAAMFYRDTTDGISDRTNNPAASTPLWVRLTRTGNSFLGEISSDGQSWTPLGTINISMPSTVRIGLAQTSHNDGVIGSASYDNVSVSGSSANQDPTASNDSASTNQDTAVVVDVLNNDSDPDAGDTLSVQSVTQGSNGSVTNNGSNVTYTPNAGFTGSDSFTYTVSDGNGGSDTATVNVTVNAVNQDPTATNDTAVTNEDTAVVVDVLNNDSDPDTGDTLSVQSVTQGSNGSVTNNGSNVTYTPNTGFTGSDSFTYTVSDGNGGSDTATVNVTVNAASASDPALRTGVLTGVSSNWQTVTLNHSYSSMVVVATPVYDGSQLPAVVRIRNASGNSFDIRVQNPSDQSLTGYDVQYMVVEEGVYTQAEHGIKMEAVRYTSTVTDTKTSWTGESRSYANSYSTPVVLGQVMTQNDAGWSTFWSRGSDNLAVPSSSTLFVGKHVGDDPDDTRNDETIGYIVIEAGSGTLSGVPYQAGVGSDTVLGLTDGAPYTYAVNVAGATSAVVSQMAMDGTDGSWGVLTSGQPVSSTQLQVAVDEEQLTDAERNHTDEQLGFIVFGSANQDPTASNDSASTNQDTAVVVDVLNNDSDPDTGDTLSVQSVTQGSNGSVTNNGSNVTYTPNAGFTGSDSFTYTVSDGNGGSDTATVNVTVNAVNQDPTATNDTAVTNEDTAVVVDVLNNDSDPDAGDTLSVQSVTQGSNGSVTNNGSNVTYTPNTGFTGSDSFTYTVSDGNGGSDTATVNVTVNASGGTTLSDDFNDNEGTNYSGWTEVPDTDRYIETGGRLDWNAGSDESEHLTLFNTPISSNDFTIDVKVTADDNVGTFFIYFAYQDSNNWYRLAVDDGASSQFEKSVGGTVTEVGLAGPGVNIAKNGALTSWQLVSDATAGTLAFNSGGANVLTISESLAFTGGQIGLGGIDRRPIWDDFVVTTNGGVVNQDPTAVNDSATTNEDTPTVIDVLANDSDPDTGDTLSVFDIVQPTHGTVVNNGSDVTYTPDSGYFGSDSFSYTVSDGNGGSDTATVNVTVNEVNQDPIAVNDSASTNEDTPTVIDVLANDSDPDTGDTLSVFDIVQPTHGTVVNNGSDVTYTPDSGYFGSDSFSYTVSDGNGGSDTATVNVTVNEITSGIGDFTANADIGAVTVTGSASYSGGVYTVSGGGEDIWLTADEFHFVHQSMTGDGEIIARIVSQDNSHPWAKTGVMIRDGLNADAANAMMGLTPGNGAGLFYRTSTGVTSQRTNTTSASTPIWVKLTRSGNTLTGYTSSNGQDWNWVGNITISMSSTVDVGLAVSSHVDGVLATASFDNVSVGDIFINQDPQASDDSASTNQNVPTVIDVLANDTDPNVGTVLTVDSVTQGANGTVTNNGSNVTYTPNAGFTGPDSFTYVVADGDGGTDTATVTVTVTGLSVGDFDEHRDIGATVLTGSASESSGTYTLTASGADIWNRADEFHFAYKPMVGDGEIVIRLTAMDNTHPWAKAGVMIRESLDPVSTFALMAQTPGNGASFAYRTETAQDAARDPLLGPGSASWLKLVRDGNTFQGYYSTDGLSWTPNGDPVEIIMDGTAYVGLAYTSHDNAVVGTASFDNLTIIETTGNHAPLAVDDQVRVAMNTPTTVAVLANDYDPDASDSLAVSAVTQPTHGTVVNNGSDVTYTPNTDYLGNDSFDYTVSDGNGGTRTATVTIDVADMGQYNVTSTSYLGGSGSIDAVRGAAILSDGTLVYAAEISDATPGGLTPVLLNGATTSSGGAVVRMSADGKTVLSVTRVADRIIDMATDDNDNIYLATFDDGFLKLNADADQLIWAKTFTGQNVWRVDAGPSGYSAVHLHGDTLGDVDRSDPGPGEIRVFNPSGTELGSYAGHNNTLDVAIDEASQTVITIGWRQASAFEGTATLPVQISYFRGHAYDGTLKYTGYDWSSNQSDPGFLNRPENNMADTRGMRATIGDDGKLYLAFEAAGGNHIFRYQPTLDTNDNFVSASSLIVGGDAYHQFFASASEHKTFVGRYEPGTGEFLLGQQFTARSTVDGDANGLRIKEGDIRADAEGRIYLGLHSASGVGNDLKDQGLPYSYSPDALEDGYGGGATLIVMSSDFTQRLFVGRVTNSGYVRALAVDTQGGDMVVAAGGDMEVVDPLVTIDPVQAAAGGGTQDGMVFTLRADLPPTGQSSFVENNGMVSVEAENYTNSTTGTGVASGIDWTTTTGTTGYSGTSAVTTSSNTGVSAGDSTVGPRLDYDINFNTTGTYYVWVRMLGNGGSNDSLHIGLDGSPASFGHLGVTHNSSNWHWEQNVGGSRLTLNVTSAGIHTLNMWMREDGVLVDKIVLTTDSQYTPSGFGPGETV